jgi:glycine cleavage system H protein
MFPTDLKFTEEHQWLKIEKNIATIGVTSYITDTLEDISYISLPEKGEELEQMDEMTSIESTRNVITLLSPLGGEVKDINSELIDNPHTLNSSPYEDGWLIKIDLADEKEIDDLMTADEYTNFVNTLEE